MYHTHGGHCYANGRDSRIRAYNFSLPLHPRQWMLISSHSSSTVSWRYKKGTTSRKSGSSLLPYFLHRIFAGSTLCCRWFGIVLLPLVSFSADGTIALWFILHSSLRYFFSKPDPPDTLAEARAIDVSIQFLLFWMPPSTAGKCSSFAGFTSLS
jgi:hypothetical protein